MLSEAELSAGAKGGAAVLDALIVRLPGIGRERLREHVDWTAARRRHARDLRGLREAESAEHIELLKRAEKELSTSEARHGRRAAGAAATLSQEANCRRLRGVLARGRATRSAAVEAESFVLEAEQTAAVAAEAAAAAKLEADRQLAKARAEVHREGCVAAAAEAQVASAAAEAAGAWMREAAAEANRLRVDFRRAEEARRTDERRALDAAAIEENEEKERRMRRLRETVAPIATRDSKRAVGATAASAAERVSTVTGESMQRVSGYTTEHLLKDQRFRVSEALHTAGLAGTSHVRHAMAAAAPFRAPRVP